MECSSEDDRQNVKDLDKYVPRTETMKILPLLASILVYTRTATAFNLPFLRAKGAGKSLRVSSADADVKNTPKTNKPKNRKSAMEFEEYEEYSRCLSPKEERADVLSEGDAFADKRPLWKKAVRAPGRLASKVLPKTRPGALIMMQCGESTFNKNQTFTGWKDAELTPQGVQESQHAGRLLLAEG